MSPSTVGVGTVLSGASRDQALKLWLSRARTPNPISDQSGVVRIEVASVTRKPGLPGLDAFGRVVESRKLLIGAQGLDLVVALSTFGRAVAQSPLSTLASSRTYIVRH